MNEESENEMNFRHFEKEESRNEMNFRHFEKEESEDEMNFRLFEKEETGEEIDKNFTMGKEKEEAGKETGEKFPIAEKASEEISVGPPEKEGSGNKIDKSFLVKEENGVNLRPHEKETGENFSMEEKKESEIEVGRKFTKAEERRKKDGDGPVEKESEIEVGRKFTKAEERRKKDGDGPAEKESEMEVGRKFTKAEERRKKDGDGPEKESREKLADFQKTIEEKFKWANQPKSLLAPVPFETAIKRRLAPEIESRIFPPPVEKTEKKMKRSDEKKTNFEEETNFPLISAVKLGPFPTNEKKNQETEMKSNREPPRQNLDLDPEPRQKKLDLESHQLNPDPDPKPKANLNPEPPQKNSDLEPYQLNPDSEPKTNLNPEQRQKNSDPEPPRVNSEPEPKANSDPEPPLKSRGMNLAAVREKTEALKKKIPRVFLVENSVWGEKKVKGRQMMEKLSLEGKNSSFVKPDLKPDVKPEPRPLVPKIFCMICQLEIEENLDEMMIHFFLHAPFKIFRCRICFGANSESNNFVAICDHLRDRHPFVDLDSGLNFDTILLTNSNPNLNSNLNSNLNPNSSLNSNSNPNLNSSLDLDLNSDPNSPIASTHGEWQMKDAWVRAFGRRYDFPEEKKFRALRMNSERYVLPQIWKTKK